ncbi:signal transduction histidine kinase [Sphingomonas sp. BE138]|uniref:ATP-binding protein n=1 Tax=Sphingomonas sp. BE138 TaxID=2817845 RepID=UPI0028588852|nr:ATP-binding protein [Sphingomonas sp. BE138]MDR6790415.1 signal transduction histidine kinase [Sphingomonas sp. BE138]
MTWQPFATGTVFVRVLGVMLGCAAAVQLVSFALHLALGPPPPRLYSLGEVAAVLRGAPDTTGEVKVSIDAEPPETRDPMARALTRALAIQLGRSLADVRVGQSSPPRIVGGPPGEPGPARREDAAPDVRDGVLVGDFVAAVRQADGRWLTAQPANSRTNAWLGRSTVWLLAALLTAIPFAWVLARWVARPIGVFAAAAERIGRDPRAAPLPIEGPAEIAHAAAAFNEMQRRLNQYVEDRTLMIGAIAHDLRTPLMRLSLRLENAPLTVRDGCERDIADMQAMIRATADYVQDVTRVGARRRLDLHTLAESVVDDYADRGEPVTFQGGDGVIVEGDAAALRSVLDNLIENALRYAGAAEVHLRSDGPHAVLEVVDRGPGVPEEELARVFEPFYRGERSRNRDTGGIGLGLASVRGVARAHGGDASLANRAGGGAVARVVLPV